MPAPENGTRVLDRLYRAGGKRLGDFLLASAALLVLALPLAALALWIAWGTPGPALIAQVRIGLGGRAFRLWKLRTMVREAESDGQARFASSGDRRLTRTGRWLRAWHGDELPQLWNVLCGHMSLVGPRPERPVWVESYQLSIPGYARRHQVRPGLTGWAQLELGYAASLDAARIKTHYDLLYVRHAGWRQDGAIARRTGREIWRSLLPRQEPPEPPAHVDWRGTPLDCAERPAHEVHTCSP